VPGFGAGAAVVSYSMVIAIGKAAIAYFLEQRTDEEVRRIFEQARSQSVADKTELDAIIRGNESSKET
jgi:flagellar motor switch protein FliG